jgi:hypothetical protein
VNVLKIILKSSAIETARFFYISPFDDLPIWTLSAGENDLEGTVIAVVNLP